MSACRVVRHYRGKTIGCGRVLAPEAAESYRSLPAYRHAGVRDALERHLRYEPTCADDLARPGVAVGDSTAACVSRMLAP
jgi:hypothetical protein